MMNIHGFENKRDAAGRPFNPYGVVYSSVDIKGMFIDAVEQNEPPESKIMAYRYDIPGKPVCAVIRSERTGIDAIYEIDFETGKPKKFFLKKTRSWFSREFKQREMERRWRDRYGDWDIE